MLSGWISECTREHQLCRESFPCQLPRRVIEIGSHTDMDNVSLRLLVTSGEKEAYTALTHCWGSKGLPPRTTKATIASRMSSMDFSSLPQTFRDAIIITRKLNISYIWIDCLCIIQDDSRDWEVESSKMASIYEGASLTISATYSTDSSGGCFRTRPPDHLQKVDFADGQQYDIFAREAIAHENLGVAVQDHHEVVKT